MDCRCPHNVDRYAMTGGESATILSFAHTLLFGIYLTSLGHCLRWLAFDIEGWKLRPKISWPTVFVTLLLFILSTGNAVVVLLMALEAIVDQDTSSTYNSMFAWSAAFGVAVLLIVDAVLIFRCWVVYFKTWLVIVFPLVLWLASFVSGIIGIVLLAPNSPWPNSIDNATLYQYILNDSMTFFSCEIGINVYVTTAIVIKILRVTRGINGQVSGRLQEIGRILGESGILFTVACIVNLLFKALALSASKFQLASLIMGSIHINTAPIVFNLILIRMAQERPHVVTGSEESSQQPILSTFQFGGSTTYGTTQDGSDIEMQVASSRGIKAEDSKLE